MENTIDRPAPVEEPRPPVIGLVVAGLAIAGMAAVSWIAWPHLAETVHGGRYDLDGSPNMVPRWLLAAAVPTIAGLISALLATAPFLEVRINRAFDLPVRRPLRDVTRAMNATIALIALFMVVVHILAVANAVGLAVPTTQVVGVSVGVFLIGIALVVPVVRSDSGPFGLSADLVRLWHRARWPVAVAVIAVGVVQIAVALLVSDVVVVSSVALLLIPAMACGLAAPLLWDRLRG
ncbi:hypothetical protein [Nocardiopsis sp. CC223A]|uniref:hypothetical protein n=1 Tax=Nocardiopsis sp. CC223A TaxID=3044051 RepID=UPI00278C591D|nr:hypothetical protein [Nocardiopsis sp. CC223A]